MNDEFGELLDFDLTAAMDALNARMEEITAEFLANMELISDDKFWLALEFDFDIDALLPPPGWVDLDAPPLPGLPAGGSVIEP
jgi:hypothetical protein